MVKHSTQNLDDLADLLDTRFRGPFGIRFGLDGLLGLIPGVGDLITNFMSAAIILQAALQGYPLTILLRMLLNFLIDNLIDMIPILGNIGDFFFKANTRNIRLLREYNLDPQRTRRRSSWWIFAVLVAIVVILATVTLAAFYLAWKVWEAIFAGQFL